jgi:SAM-dependent methyltransferase
MNSHEDERQYWEHLYHDNTYVYGTLPNRYLAAQVPYLRPGTKALVIGDGEGRNGVWLASQGMDVVSVDFSQRAIEKARRLASQHKVSLSLQCCDLLAYDWPTAAFNLVASIYVHLSPRERVLIHRRLISSLRPGGLLVLEAFHPRHAQSAGNQQVLSKRFYDAATLRFDFSDLEIIELGEAEITLDEGTMHQGTGEVTRLVARKKIIEHF